MVGQANIADTEKYLDERLAASGLADAAARKVHAKNVAELAVHYVTQYFVETGFHDWLPPQQLNAVSNMQHAGLLHETISYMGGDFDTLCRLVNYDTAMIVATCSYDARLPGPRREQELRVRLYEAGPDAQLLQLADLVATTASVLAQLKKGVPPAVVDQMFTWSVLMSERVVAATNKLDTIPFFRDVRRKLASDFLEIKQIHEHHRSQPRARKCS